MKYAERWVLAKLSSTTDRGKWVTRASPAHGRKYSAGKTGIGIISG